MRKPTADELARARAEGLLAQRTEPRATHAEYDRDRNVVLVRLTSGTWFGFSPSAVAELRGASAEDLAAVEVEAFGEALHWEALDAGARRGRVGARDHFRRAERSSVVGPLDRGAHERQESSRRS
jgi:hypothetical protein